VRKYAIGVRDKKVQVEFPPPTKKKKRSSLTREKGSRMYVFGVQKHTKQLGGASGGKWDFFGGKKKTGGGYSPLREKEV